MPVDTPYDVAPLGPQEFGALRRYVFEQAGISIGEQKQQFMSARLARRLRALGLTDYSAYLAYLVADASGAERQELINCITTNKTDFFREVHHFEFLKARLEERAARLRPHEPKRLRIWSAGCSTGEEPYSLAMTVLDTLRGGHGWDVRILATDIDTAVLAQAAAGRYAAERTGGLTEHHARTYFKALSHGLEALPRLRELIRFRPLNLVAHPFPFRGRFDFIFCRNVIIYFDGATRRRVIEAFSRHLEPDGHLVVGHSENLYTTTDLFELAGNTVYRPARRERARPLQVVPDVASPVVRIVAGGVHAANKPTILQTTLGSCVSACLYDAEARVGGMNHFMLPDSKAAGECANRYGVHAMTALLRNLDRLGAERGRLKAKVFGAASVLHPHVSSSEVPDSNARFVREFLQGHGIPIVAERIGGTDPLEVRFHTATGRAQVRVVSRAEVPAIATEEARYEKEAEEALKSTPDAATTVECVHRGTKECARRCPR